MEKLEIMRERHSVRKYLDRKIEPEKVDVLKHAVEQANRDGGLHIQLFTEEPEAFSAGRFHYGDFKGCTNYFALVGPKNAEEKIGYYGEKLVLFAQELGLNTCWVALTYKKGKVRVEPGKGEKLHMVISLGYGETQGTAHRSRPAEEVSNLAPDSPEWFRNGMEAVMLAPTAVNQQKFFFERTGDTVRATAGLGFYTKTDLGIAKYHFELGACKNSFRWA